MVNAYMDKNSLWFQESSSYRNRKEKKALFLGKIFSEYYWIGSQRLIDDKLDKVSPTTKYRVHR